MRKSSSSNAVGVSLTSNYIIELGNPFSTNFILDLFDIVNVFCSAMELIIFG